MEVQIGFVLIPMAAGEWLRRQPRRLAAGRFFHAIGSVGRRAAVLLPPGYGANWEAVLLRHGVRGEVSWRLCRTKWCCPRRWHGCIRDEGALDPIAFFHLVVGVLFVKMQGPVCYLGLVRGPFAYCCVPPLFYY